MEMLSIQEERAEERRKSASRFQFIESHTQVNHDIMRVKYKYSAVIMSKCKQ